MQPWRLYYRLEESAGRYAVVAGGVLRPEQKPPEDAMALECAGGKEESIWVYRAVRNQLAYQTFASREEAQDAVLSLLEELRGRR